MKRRNAECGKLRRPIKRNKIAEGMYGSNTFLYMKYLILWAVVITADFMLDFRFEFLWPFWLLLRSVYDSFKYKGLAFSILFVCIAITSDLVCLFFIPVSWLFFLASTYVWVQYVWHADKGFCLPTIFLWMLFLYLEGAIRWRDDSKSIPHVDLCRPFAAHCIGYPVVTLGFGVKSYVGYRIRQRKQREVAKENEFYMQLLQLALPSDDPVQDELMSQLPQSTETLHSDELGDIVLPVPSPVAAQQLQQQQMVLATSAAAASAKALAATAAATAAANNGTAGQSTQQSNANSAKHLLNNSNNSILSSRTLNLSTSTNIGNGHTVNGLPGTTSAIMNGVHSTGVNHLNNSSNNIGHSTSAAGVTLRANHRKSLDRNDRHSGGENASRANAGSANHKSDSHNAKRSTFQGGALRDAGKMTESMSSSIWSSIRCRLFGGGASKTNDSHAASNANSAGNYVTTARRHDDDDADMAVTEMDINHHQIENSSASAAGRTTNEPSGRSSKELRNNNIDYGGIGTATAAATAPNAHPASAKHERDNSKTSNSNYSTDINNDTHYHPHHNHHLGNNKEKHLKQNGNIAAMEMELNAVSAAQNNDNNSGESLEKSRGRRNRAKQKDAAAAAAAAAQQNSKDNQQSSVGSGGSAVNHHHNHHPYVPEIKENGTSHTAVSQATSVANSMPQTCDSCHRLEAEIKKIRNENHQLKQYEADLRQKCDINANMKNCLLAKQRENDELEKKIQELTNARQFDRQNLQQTERRLGDERRQKQSLDSLLNNERKQRKQAEEKAARTECGESCKQRKQLLENECKQLRRELTAADEMKKSAEQQSRTYEQELRKFEAELRNRESREGTEVLMTALQAVQDKNSTLEKNLSAETRVKLDLFSALGEAKRQLEIRENVIRQKDKEVLELKGKIAQLFAVMPSVPNDSFCMTQCSSNNSSMLRMNDTPPLQGPSSPMAHAHMSLGGSPLMNQLQNLSVFTSTSNSMSPQTPTSQVPSVVQQPGGGVSGGNGGGGGGGGLSNLDPNAIAYTPKNVGAEA